MKEKYLHFDSIDSTSKYLKEHASEVNDFTFVSSDFQTAGHGRNLRQWFSNKRENLLFSFVIKDKKIIPHYPKLSIATAYVIAKFIENKYGLRSFIKWPNDVFINNKKICGILLESTSINNEIATIVVGVGLNVNQNDFPNGLNNPATSLSSELKEVINLDVIKNELFSSLEKYLKNIDKDNSFIKYAQSHDFLKGKEVYSSLYGNEAIKVVGINSDCTLKIIYQGKEKNLFSGEIL